jgi:hypothetical protein
MARRLLVVLPAPCHDSSAKESTMRTRYAVPLLLAAGLGFFATANFEPAAVADTENKPPQRPLRMDPPHFSTDPAVKID